MKNLLFAGMLCLFYFSNCTKEAPIEKIENLQPDPNLVSHVAIDCDDSDNIIFFDGNAHYKAIAYNAYGAIINSPIEWTVSDPSIANIDHQGQLQGISTGSVQVQATAMGVNSSALELQLASKCAYPNGPFYQEVSFLDPDYITLTVGSTIQLSGRFDTKLYPECCASICSNNDHIASIDSDNLLTAHTPGRAVLTISISTNLDFIPVLVLP